MISRHRKLLPIWILLAGLLLAGVVTGGAALVGAAAPPMGAGGGGAPFAPQSVSCGTANFGAATNFAMGTSPHSVAVGDFNRDNSVSVLDFNNQKSNFGQSGSALTCP